MPILDGFAATTQIRALPDGRGARLPIIALTANALDDDEQRCLAAGMSGYLCKPYTLDQLHATLARWLPSSTIIDALTDTAPSPSPLDTGADPDAIDRNLIASLRELDDDGGYDLVRELLQCFLEVAEPSITQVEQAILAGDAQALGKAAHTLKSSSANVGAKVLSGCYHQLEHLAREHRIDEAREQLPLVRREHRRAVSQMRDLLLEIA